MVEITHNLADVPALATIAIVCHQVDASTIARGERRIAGYLAVAIARLTIAISIPISISVAIAVAISISRLAFSELVSVPLSPVRGSSVQPNASRTKQAAERLRLRDIMVRR